MKLNFILFTGALLCGVSFAASAQIEVTSPEPRKFGLTASLQRSQFDIQMPVWLGSKTTLAPSVSIATGSDAGSDIGLGLVPRFYFKEPVKFAPYLSPKAGILLFSPKGGESTTDFLVGIGFGGEYFLDTNFSMGVEAQANVTKSDGKSTRFGNPGGTNLNTGAAIHANVYF